MDQQRQQVLEQIKKASNVLITVSTNPTVDELAASIGLTIALNKMNKHAVTVFSGSVPSTIEFLQPDKTIETTTDSLRDFIIALDKSKADKLRYKVEKEVVRIFITPYRTTITDKDLQFSQGEFNIDVIIALGVTKKEDLDKAITAHGRILHNATVIAVTKRETASNIGSINWQDKQASSLCEMIAGLTSEIQPDAIDGQMATALLTGIIAETDRFKNDKTTPNALALSSKLMASGANQQLIAEKLDESVDLPKPLNSGGQQSSNTEDNGELDIQHDSKEVDKIHIDDNGNIAEAKEVEAVAIDNKLPSNTPVVDKPAEQQPTSTTEDLPIPQESVVKEEEQPTLQQPSNDVPMMQHEKTINPISDDIRPKKSDKPFDLKEAMQESGSTTPPTVQPSSEKTDSVDASKPDQDQTLIDLETSVKSPHSSGSQMTPVGDLLPEQASVDQSGSQTSSSPTTVTPPAVISQKAVVPLPPPPPPSVPPPMTPQFYDANGENSNPFLDPGKK